jgi:hypothetical protein
MRDAPENAPLWQGSRALERIAFTQAVCIGFECLIF